MPSQIKQLLSMRHHNELLVHIDIANEIFGFTEIERIS